MKKLLRERNGRLEAEDIPPYWRIQKESRFRFGEITDFDDYIAKTREKKNAKREFKEYLKKDAIAREQAIDSARRNKGLEDFMVNLAGVGVGIILGSQALPYAYYNLVGGDTGEKTKIMVGTSLVCLAMIAIGGYKAIKYLRNRSDDFLREKYPDVEFLLDNGYDGA